MITANPVSKEVPKASALAGILAKTTVYPEKKMPGIKLIDKPRLLSKLTA